MKLYPIKPFCDVVVHVAFSKKTYNKAIKQKTRDTSVLVQKGDQGRATYLESNDTGAPFFIVGIFVDDISYVVHEASHTTTYIMEHLNIKDDEFRAYTVGFLTERICHRLKQIKDD